MQPVQEQYDTLQPQKMNCWNAVKSKSRYEDAEQDREGEQEEGENGNVGAVTSPYPLRRP